MTVRRLKAELVEAADAILGEGPTWDASRQRLSWVDILGGRIHVCDAEGRTLESHSLRKHVAAALPSEDGGWLVVAHSGFGLLDQEGSYSTLLEVPGIGTDIRFNDAKCDPQGRALAGTMRYDETAGHGTLYRLDDGPSAVPLLSKRGLCNGIGWSLDGHLFYFIDSLTFSVATYGYDPVDGILGQVGQLATFDKSMGLPDGLCVDDDGGVWVAFYGGGALHRYRPSGKLDTIVELPVPYPTSMSFGGAKSDRLFITSAGGTGHRHLDEPSSAAGYGNGGLWAVDPDITGPPVTLWRPVVMH